MDNFGKINPWTQTELDVKSNLAVTAMLTGSLASLNLTEVHSYIFCLWTAETEKYVNVDSTNTATRQRKHSPGAEIWISAALNVCGLDAALQEQERVFLFRFHWRGVYFPAISDYHLSFYIFLLTLSCLHHFVFLCSVSFLTRVADKSTDHRPRNPLFSISPSSSASLLFKYNVYPADMYSLYCLYCADTQTLLCVNTRLWSLFLNKQIKRLSRFWLRVESFGSIKLQILK